MPGGERPEGVSVVIPAYAAATTLPTQLAALADQAGPGLEVIVVDNASPDDTRRVALAARRTLPGLRVVSATRGRGVGYARNAGTSVATGECVLYCDADDQVRPGWVAAMTAGLAEAGLVGGVLDVRRINSPRTRSLSWPPDMDRLPTAMRHLPYAVGATMGVRRRVWAELGGFDETFVGGHEEVDFAWRAQRAGHRVAFAPTAVVDYRLRDTVGGVVRQRFGYGRTYAQLYSRHADEPIPRARLRHEVRVVGDFVMTAPREFGEGRGPLWLAGAAWIAGRWRGNLAYRVRCPL